MKRYKLAIVASHPIQYQSPLFRYLSEDPRFEVMVYYCWDFGISKKGFDKELNIDIKWDIPLLNGYKYKLLKNYSFKPSPSFFGQINLGIISELKKNKYDAVLVHGYTTATSWLVFLSRYLILSLRDWKSVTVDTDVTSRYFPCPGIQASKSYFRATGNPKSPVHIFIT